MINLHKKIYHFIMQGSVQVYDMRWDDSVGQGRAALIRPKEVMICIDKNLLSIILC